MNDADLGAVVRAMRHRRGWRQIDLGKRAGVSAGSIGLLERGRLERVSLRAIRRIVGVLDIRLGWDLGWRGAELARLRDADHAAIAQQLVQLLSAAGWVCAAEVSFNHFGDRGRIDILAFHPASRTLLVIEIKTVIADIQSLLGALDVKLRLARGIAVARGWQPKVSVPALVIGDGRTNRRRIHDHEPLFARFVLRGWSARQWLRAPSVSEGLLFFEKLPNRKGVDARRAGLQRVRLKRTPVRSAEGGEPA